MTKRRSSKPAEAAPPAQPLQETEITDEAGFPGLVLYPEGADPQEGLPLHLDLDSIFGHLPEEFRKRLYQALWDRGLKLPQDFLQPDSAQRYKSAVLHVIKHDFYNVQALAREVIDHG